MYENRITINDNVLRRLVDVYLGRPKPTPKFYCDADQSPSCPHVEFAKGIYHAEQREVPEC